MSLSDAWSRIRAFVSHNRKAVSVGALCVLILLFGWWSRYNFSFQFSEQQAQGPLEGLCASVGLEGQILPADGDTRSAKVRYDVGQPGTNVTLAVYKVNYNGQIDRQTLHDSVTVFVKNDGQVGASQLQVSLPACRYQIDLVEGDPLEPPFYGGPGSGHCLLAVRESAETVPYCDQVPSPTPTPSETPTPTITPTPTPTPSSTPTPTPTPSQSVSPSPTKNPSPSPSPTPGTPVLSAQCIGGATPRVVLNWTAVKLATEQTILRSTPKGEAVVLTGPGLGNLTTYTDASVVADRTYLYSLRVSSNPQVVSNTVTVDTSPVLCGLVVSPSVSPSPTLSPSPSVTPTPSASSTPTPTPSQGGGGGGGGGITARLSLAKTVLNITRQGIETESAPAQPTDTVEFVIRVTSNGNTTATNVRLNDLVPTGLTLQAGTVTLDGVAVATDLTGNGLVIGNLEVGRTAVVRFRALVSPESAFALGVSSLVNSATATSSNAGSASDTALVTVTRSQATTVGGETYVLSISKLGRDETKQQTGERSLVETAPNDIVVFIIRVKSLSTARIDSVNLKDFLPSGVTYINDSTIINGVAVGNGLTTSGGISLGSLDPNQEVVIQFKGRVASSSAFATGSTTILNTAQASAPNAATVIAQLPLVLSIGTISSGGTVSTGNESSLQLAVSMSVLVTLMYLVYTRTSMFKRRDLESQINADGEEFHWPGSR